MGSVFSSSETKSRQDYYIVIYSDDVHSYECVIARFIPILGINVTPTNIELVEDRRNLDNIQEEEIILGIMIQVDSTKLIRTTSADLVTSLTEAESVLEQISEGEAIPAYVQELNISH